MDELVLSDIGLTAGESKVYLGLLELGECNAGDIKRKSGLQNSVVHLCLNNLIQKGLINYVQKGRRRFYTATNPKHLLDFIDEKRRKIQQIMPSLLQKQKNTATHRVVVFEGVKGLRAMLEDMLLELHRGEEYVVLGSPKEAHELFEPFLLDFHERRQSLKIHMRAVYKSDAKEYAELRRKMKFVQIKYLPDSVDSPMWINVYHDKTLLFITGDVLLGIVIESKIVANNFKEYFTLMWNIAK